MKILIVSAGLAALTLSGGFAQAGPVEYVRICDVYGTGFFYIPGTDRCIRPDTGEIRYETVDGTVRTETELAARVRALENRMADWDDFDSHIAISNALQSPDLVAGETFGVRLNWGAGASSHAFGFTGAVTFGEGFLDGGRGRLSGYSGVAFSGGKVGGNAGVQFSW